MDRNEMRSPTVTAAPHGEAPAEEALVADARAGLTPSQMVERKFVGALQSGALFVSHLQGPALFGRRPG